MKRCFEYGLWKLILKNITVHLVGIYRPPSLSTPSQFNSDFFSFIEDIIPKYSNLMIMGDFNLHINTENNFTSDFQDSLFAMGLEQHVNFSTHTGGNILDLVITESVRGVELLSCQQGPFISDHCVIKIVTNVPKENIKSETVISRNFKDMDKQTFAQDLGEISVDSEDLDTYVTHLENAITDVLDKNAPVKEKTKIIREPKPWFTENILKLKRKCRRAERLWKKHRQPNQFIEMKNTRKEYYNELNREKTRTLSEKVSNFKGDSKKLYQFVNELTGTKSDNPMPTSESDNALAEEFADYFMSKIDKIRYELRDFENYDAVTKEVPSFRTFNELTQDEVKKLIGELQTKTCQLDVLPTNILKSFLNELLPLITKLVNISLRQGIFPSEWKQAIVRPLLKKSGLELTSSNYRPVSNLPFLSKLIEKAALSRLQSHVNEHSLLPKNQSAYRRFHSCETALLRLVNDLLDGMEKQEVTALIAIDLSAAFDTVDHDILIDVLQKQYGVCDTALDWIDSYLRPRSFRVSVNSALSSPHQIRCSVPQGSCLGPWLYLTYAGTLFDVIPPSVTVYGFADDHTANKRFRPVTENDEYEAIRELEECAVIINNWMNSNKLKMNASKTEFILFGSKSQLSRCHTKLININGDEIKVGCCIKYLGAHLDENLNFKEHVKMKCRTAMINYLRIKSIRKYLTKEATEILVLSLVISHLDYCNVILYGIAQSEINKMQRIQNMCAKLVLNRRKFDSSSEALYDLHWLPIKARITFKILIIVYNCSINQAPAYLTDLLIIQRPNPRLRSAKSAEGCYLVPSNKHKTFSDRGFSTIGPKLWNNIPLDIRQAENIEIFKKKLKTYYFAKFHSLF
ncbi:hypothetical protein FSP39_000910 [Pinctada imbricata]|uniref:Reverse transcriptase domain-containing protein n=1 Tax=Pinctada imbricata TaxID=66713 RepID=A0AA88YG22_PINIB|nr:hypothetical protein FSP39_000910 [Pinctada imbricata]